MILLKSLVFWLVQVTSLVIWGSVFLITAPFANHVQRLEIAMFWMRFVVLAARWICGIRWRMVGLEALEERLRREPDFACIVCSKHQSAWETLFLVAHLPRRVSYVFKRELLMIPFFGWALGLLGMVAIDRSRGKEAFAQIAALTPRQFAMGRWMLFFPEGTRTAPGQKVPYKLGAAKLAVTLNRPILPIGLNSGSRWPKGSLLRHPGLITVQIGEPMWPESASASAADETIAAAALMGRVEAWIEAHSQEMPGHEPA